MIGAIGPMIFEPPVPGNGLVETSSDLSPRSMATDVVAPKPVEQKSGARLAFDSEAHRTFVEFLDPDTGDVVARFPAEDVSRHLDKLVSRDALAAGTLVDSVA